MKTNVDDNYINVREFILNEANKCVNGKREQDYGSPEDNFNAIADLWNVYLQHSKFSMSVLDAHDVAMMMSLLKIARISTGKGKKPVDSYIDLAGYAACAGEINAIMSRDREERGGEND